MEDEPLVFFFEAGGAVGFIWLVALWCRGQRTEKTHGDCKGFEGG